MSTTSREVPGALRPMKLAPALAAVSTSTARAAMPLVGGLLERQPTAATCGSVNTTRGEPRVSARGGRPSLPSDPVDADARLVLAHVGEQRAAVDVADRVQPIRAADPHPVVDLEVAAGLDPDRLEPELGGARTPADGDQELVAAQLLAALEAQRDLPASPREAPIALTPVRTSTPPASSPAVTCALANGSSPASTRSSASTRVTLAPRLAHACAISTPTTPPPRISSRPGTSLAVVASRFVHGRASARPSIGGTAAVVPVAITTALARRQAIVADDHGALAVERAAAADQLDPALLEPRDHAAVVEVVDDLVAACEHRRRVELAAGAARATPGTRSTSSSSSPGRSSAFDGMQA